MGAVRTGTLAWARATHGRMRPRDVLGQLTSGLTAQLRVFPKQVRYRRTRRSAASPVLDASLFVTPDSEAATEAGDLARRVLSPAILNHCLRTYVFGKAFAVYDGVRYDDELLYLACLFHDHGLVESYAGTWDRSACFALDGAAAADQFLAVQGWDPPRRDTVAEAITLHLNVVVPVGDGPEAHLLHAGAAYDVAGVRAWDVAETDRAAAVDRHPRAGLKAELGACWARQCDLRPESRAAFLERYLQFSTRIRNAPFDE